MTKKVAFLGCGSWGAALGQVLAEKNVPITMWHRDSKIVKKMCTTRKHYLIPSLSIHNDITITSQLSNALNDADIVVLAIPSQSIRSLLKTTKSFLRNVSYIVNVAKGIENGTLMTMSEVIYDELHILPNVITLSICGFRTLAFGSVVVICSYLIIEFNIFLIKLFLCSEVLFNFL